jgi:hypothetical protein
VSAFRGFRVASSSSGTLSIPGLRSQGTGHLPVPRLTWRGRFVCARLRTGARVLVNEFLEAVVCCLSPCSLKVSSTSSLLHIQHGQREYSCNLTNVRLDILRVIETPGTTFKDKIRFPFVSIWGDLSCGFHHKPT